MADSQKSKKAKLVFTALRIAVVVCGIIWASVWMTRENLWGKLGEIFMQMRLWVFAVSLGIFIVGQIIIALRWWILLRSQSIYIDLVAVIKLHFMGLFYNNFMPSSVGGDLIRAWYVTKHTEKKFEAALSVFVDRVIGLASTVVIASLFYILFLRGRGEIIASTGTSDQSSSLIETVGKYKHIALLLVVFVLAVFCCILAFDWGRKALAKVTTNIKVHGLNIFNKLKNAAFIYCSRPLTILAVFGLTVFMQLLVITGFWFLGRDLGIEAGLKYYYVFFTLAWVVGTIPVSIGGAVVVEVFLASLFIKFAGIGEEAAAALALCQRAVWMIASLPGAFIHLIGGHLPKEFSIDYEEPVD